MRVAVGWAALLLGCFAAVTGSIEARSIVTLPTANTIQQALTLMDDFKGNAEDFRIAIADKVFDSAGVNAAILLDRALKRGWEYNGFEKILEFRVYRFRQISSQPAQPAQPAQLSKAIVPIPPFARSGVAA